jgi:hypothetical protein
MATKNCEHCGYEFAKNPRLSLKQWAATRFCSTGCRAAADSMAKLNSQKPLRDLFAESYTVNEETGCWNWTGAVSSQGYGTVRHMGTAYRAHMLSLELDGQPRPQEKVACHHCDNRRCVNPAHLYWGTAADNVGDASRRNRLRVGGDNHNAKLDAEAVRLIKSSSATNTELAKKFSVTRQAIRAVRTGKNWRSVE